MAKLRITYNAPVVLTFTLAAVAVFCLTRLVTPMQSWFQASPELDSIQSYVGLFSHILGHASWEHLLGNFMLILLIGPILEERHGSGPLLVMILLTALITGIANALLSSAGLQGASGIVFMMILLASMANMKSREIPLTFIAVAIIYLGGEIVHSFRSDNISQLAHLVGGAAGAAFGFFMAGKRGKAAEPKAVVAAGLDLKGLKAK
ncbi:MAG TPA: rhomboid family intramembrane serine protease [Kofleriaceae bacterium]|nr:rhomboid family intramembrane serine protease [Kofleriaceae bacterium]